VIVFKHTFGIPLNEFGTWTQFAKFQRPINDDIFEKITLLWAENEQMTFDEFYEKYDAQACTDWNKKQPNGEFYGDLWDEDVDDPWKVLRKANGKALHELPYPPQTILLAMKYLCPYRCDSVIEVRDWLAWVDHDIKHPEQRARHDFSQYPSTIAVVDKEPEDPSGHVNVSRVDNAVLSLTHADGTTETVPLTGPPMES